MQAFVQWGGQIQKSLNFNLPEWENCIGLSMKKNGWFEPVFVINRLKHIATWLQENELKKIFKSEPCKAPRKVLVIGSGNIPLAAFHDVLCVLISGHQLVLKSSTEDDVLLPFLLEKLVQIHPEIRTRIHFAHGPLKNHKPDAVIASGSDASEKIFREYFGHLPHIFRKSRTTVALINGNESDEMLKRLADDVFLYFGLGCRNVGTLFIPEGYALDAAVTHWHEKYGKLLMQNKKYANNYDYYKAVFTLSKIPFLDFGFFLLRFDSPSLFSPPAVLNAIPYKTLSDAFDTLENHQSSIEIKVSDAFGIPFGNAQFPVINEYQDGIDTMEFLVNLN